MHDEAKTALMAGIQELAEVVLVTMGPGGRTVIVSDNMGVPYITKDGVSVAKGVSFEDPLKNIGANIIKEVAMNTVREAGDGTTTSICLAWELISKGLLLMEEGDWSYQEVKLELELLKDEAIRLLDDMREECNTGEMMVNVATIAANGDSTIGNLIASALSNAKTVKVEAGREKFDKTDIVEGMELKAPLFDNAFINNASRQSIEYKEAKIIIMDGGLSDLKGVNKIFQALPANTPVIIMAEDFTQQTMRVLKENHNRGAIVVGLVKSPGYSEHRRNLLEDIKLATKAKTISGLALGDIKAITSTKEKTIITYDRYPELETYVDELRESMKHMKEDYTKELMQQRIDNLVGKLVTITVGGDSEIEMKERYDRIEDALLATQCALDEGVVEGGGMALLQIGNESDNNFSEALFGPFKTIMENNDGSLDDLKTKSVIDPVKVVKVALTNAISVAKTVLGTEAIVINPNSWR